MRNFTEKKSQLVKLLESKKISRHRKLNTSDVTFYNVLLNENKKHTSNLYNYTILQNIVKKSLGPNITAT